MVGRCLSGEKLVDDGYQLEHQPMRVSKTKATKEMVMRDTPKPDLPIYFSEQDMKLDAFDTLCSEPVQMSDYFFAHSVEKNVVIYEGETLRQYLDT